MRKVLRWLFTAFLVLQTAVEYLAFPGLLAVIGLLNGFGWEYYLCTIGGYAVLVILAEAVGGFLGKRLGGAIAARLSKALKHTRSSDSDIAS